MIEYAHMNIDLMQSRLFPTLLYRTIVTLPRNPMLGHGEFDADVAKLLQPCY
jgi:hypothetical protein